MKKLFIVVRLIHLEIYLYVVCQSYHYFEYIKIITLRNVRLNLRYNSSTHFMVQASYNKFISIMSEKFKKYNVFSTI
nr:MAG TPA: hypothetical protein [Caudoviricetes sp.]